MRDQQARGEVGEQRPLRCRVGPRRLEQQLNSHFEAFDRVFLARRRGADLLGRPTKRVLEQRKQEFVLAIKLQVEAS